MIKNIIFDLGNVLIEYNPERFISEFVEEKNQERFYKRVFKEQEWQDLDRGTLEYDEAIKIFTKDLPEEKESIEKLFKENIQGVLFPIEENLKLLPKLKEKGYKLYILSNFHREAFLEVSKLCKFDESFDGGVVSYDVKLLKPEKEIYLELLNRYNLKPEETLFIDDTLPNIEACRKLGITGIHLKNKEDLKAELENLLEIQL